MILKWGISQNPEESILWLNCWFIKMAGVEGDQKRAPINEKEVGFVVPQTNSFGQTFRLNSSHHFIFTKFSIFFFSLLGPNTVIIIVSYRPMPNKYSTSTDHKRGSINIKLRYNPKYKELKNQF